MRQAFKILAVAAACVILFGACGGGGRSGEEASGEYPMTVENCGREITIEERPERLYVIGGEAGTLVHAAGGSDRVSAFSPLAGEPLGDAADALGEAEQFPIQTATDMSRETIIGAEPDLVVTFGLSGFGPEDLESVGIPTVIVSGYCGGFGSGESEVEDPLEAVFDDVTTLGRILGTEEEAESAASELRERVEAVRESAEASPPPEGTSAAVFVGTPDSPLGAYGRRSMIHQQMTDIGLTNVFEGSDERYFEVNTEAFIDRAPERLIALYEPGDTSEAEVREILTGRPELSDIPAIESDNVFVLDFYYSGHGTLAVDGLEQLSEQVSENE